MPLGAAMIGAFLAFEGGATGPIRVPDDTHADEPTSIFYAQRLDYEMILRLMPKRKCRQCWIMPTGPMPS